MIWFALEQEPAATESISISDFENLEMCVNPVQICRGIIQSSEKGSFEYVRLRFLRQRVLRPDAKGGDGDLEMQETALYLYKVVHLPPILLIDRSSPY